MFITVSLEDVIRVPPGSLGGAVAVRGVLADELEARYADAVLPGIGLVVCLWAIDAVAGARVAPGDGGAYTRVSGGRRVGGRLLCCAGFTLLEHWHCCCLRLLRLLCLLSTQS